MQNADNIYELAKLIAEQQWDKITDEDWEAMLAALSERRAWEEMWRLAQKAPAWWSVQVLLRLKEAGTWSLPDGTLLHTLKEYKRYVQALAISADRRVLVDAGVNFVHLWTLALIDLRHVMID